MHNISIILRNVPLGILIILQLTIKHCSISHRSICLFKHCYDAHHFQTTTNHVEAIKIFMPYIFIFHKLNSLAGMYA